MQKNMGAFQKLQFSEIGLIFLFNLDTVKIMNYIKSRS